MDEKDASDDMAKEKTNISTSIRKNPRGNDNSQNVPTEKGDRKNTRNRHIKKEIIEPQVVIACRAALLHVLARFHPVR